MKINREKRIGRILFIVEGSQTEFVLLRRIFCNLLGYSYLEKRRSRPTFFVSKQDVYSQVAVINTRESNIRDISENDDYLDEVMDVLRETYHFPVDQSAIYYLFDRDPKSNLNVPLIQHYIETLTDPYDNADNYRAGQLLLSYPSIESFTISNFVDDTKSVRFRLGSEAKAYIGEHPKIQNNKLSEDTLVHAAREFLQYLTAEGLDDWDMDHFAPTSASIFTKQEADYLEGPGFKSFSMLTLAFLQMGLLELE
jgi:hypothetical protein